MRVVRASAALAVLCAWLVAPGAAQRVLRVTPPPVVWIPEGEARLGSTEDALRVALSLCADARAAFVVDPICPSPMPELLMIELPAHEAILSAFGIDRTEVTVADYQRCVDAGACAPPRAIPPSSVPDPGVLPVSGVTWAEARAFCEFRGGRLPTEAEWERAAGGDGRRLFPWGNLYNDRLANHGGAGMAPGQSVTDDVDGYVTSAPVGSFPSGASPFGLLDMAGNVAEWVEDGFEQDAYSRAAHLDPHTSPDAGPRILRGGSWRSEPIELRVAARSPQFQTRAASWIGFRCAY